MTWNRRNSHATLTEKCLACLNCCKDTVVPVNDHDVRRLMDHTGLPADDIVRLWGPEDVTSPASDPDWIHMDYGRRMMGLKKKRGGESCRFLSQEGFCTVYTHRPGTCRTYPFNVYLDEDNTIERVTIARGVKCNFVAADAAQVTHLQEDVRHEMHDIERYHEKIRAFEDKGGRGGKRGLLKHLGFGKE